MKTWTGVVVLCAGLAACGDDPVTVDPGVAGDGTLTTHLESIRGRNAIPVLAALLLEGDQVLESGAVGLRAAGSAEAVTRQRRCNRTRMETVLPPPTPTAQSHPGISRQRDRPADRPAGDRSVIAGRYG